MEESEQNQGSFDVIKAIGKAASPNEAEATEQAKSIHIPADLAERQRRYLWECTFEVL